MGWVAGGFGFWRSCGGFSLSGNGFFPVGGGFWWPVVVSEAWVDGFAEAAGASGGGVIVFSRAVSGFLGPVSVRWEAVSR